MDISALNTDHPVEAHHVHPRTPHRPRPPPRRERPPHPRAAGNLGNAALYTPDDGDNPEEESFEELFFTADFEEASIWLEEWLADVS